MPTTHSSAAVSMAGTAWVTSVNTRSSAASPDTCTAIKVMRCTGALFKTLEHHGCRHQQKKNNTRGKHGGPAV